MDTLSMLQELLEQDQFELIFRKKAKGREYKNEEEGQEICLIYLMNDAVESFLVFQGARMTGEYRKDYEGELDASLSHDGREYILVVRQGSSVVTLFFEEILLEVHLYDYGEIGHFWVKEYEYLRQLEYRIAILRDKLDYLGEEFCTLEERKLASLADFPPLNYCSYAAVPEKYIVPREGARIPSEEAITVFEDLTGRVDDRRMQRILRFYRKHPYPIITKVIAWMLHQNVHAGVVDLLSNNIKKAASVYPRRSFGTTMDIKYRELMKRGEERQKELRLQGRESVLLREEPFVNVKDGVEFQVHLMIWKKGIVNRKVEVESYR